VVDEADRAQRGGQPEHQPARRRRTPTVQRDADQLGAEVAGPDPGNDRDTAHRRCTALLVVARRPVLADLVPEPLPGEQPDQHRREEKRDRQRDADGDEDLPHPRQSSATSASARAPSPAALEAFTSTTSPALSSDRSNASAASASATMATSAPHDPSITAPWCMALIDLPVPTTTSRDPSNRTASRPMRSCSDIASSPSSAISPSTAQLRRFPAPAGGPAACEGDVPAPASRAMAASALSPARMESGFALYASLITVTPSSRVA